MTPTPTPENQPPAPSPDAQPTGELASPRSRRELSQLCANLANEVANEGCTFTDGSLFRPFIDEAALHGQRASAAALRRLADENGRLQEEAQREFPWRARWLEQRTRAETAEAQLRAIEQMTSLEHDGQGSIANRVRLRIEQLLATEAKCAGLEAEVAALREDKAQLLTALESAPSPVCVAGEPNTPYDAPHTVRNFAAVDRWWVVTRSDAIDLARANQG